MAKRPDMLHVKSYLALVEEISKDMLERDGKYLNGLKLAPIDRDALAQLKLLAGAILRKHAAKHTRKDIYVEA